MELNRKLCAMRRKLSQRYWLDDRFRKLAICFGIVHLTSNLTSNLISESSVI